MAFGLQAAAEPRSAAIQLIGPADYREVLYVPTVDIADGVSAKEATAIAEFVFLKHAWIGCGTVEPKGDTEDLWLFQTRIGYAGTLGAVIEIDKSTATVSWPDPTLLRYAAVHLDPWFHLAGPRPLHAVAPALPPETERAVKSLEESIILIVPLTITPSGDVTSIGTVHVVSGDAILAAEIADEVESIAKDWKFYPGFADSPEPEIHPITVFIGHRTLIEPEPQHLTSGSSPTAGGAD
jgi:hypothetical protein